MPRFASRLNTAGKLVCTGLAIAAIGAAIGIPSDILQNRLANKHFNSRTNHVLVDVDSKSIWIDKKEARNEEKQILRITIPCDSTVISKNQDSLARDFSIIYIAKSGDTVKANPTIAAFRGLIEEMGEIPCSVKPYLNWGLFVKVNLNALVIDERKDDSTATHCWRVMTINPSWLASESGLFLESTIAHESAHALAVKVEWLWLPYNTTAEKLAAEEQAVRFEYAYLDDYYKKNQNQHTAQAVRPVKEHGTSYCLSYVFRKKAEDGKTTLEKIAQQYKQQYEKIVKQEEQKFDSEYSKLDRMRNIGLAMACFGFSMALGIACACIYLGIRQIKRQQRLQNTGTDLASN